MNRKPNVLTVLNQAYREFLLAIIWLSAAASQVGATEPISLEAVKTILGKQRENIKSLHLRIRRETTLTVDPKVFSSWSSRPTLPEYVGTDEVLVAFKADKRYQRLLELEYDPATSVAPISNGDARTKPFIDEARAWTGKNLLERNRSLQSGKYEYITTPGEKALDSFPPLSYLTGVGLAVPDPTAKDEAHRNLQLLGTFPALFEHWPYRVLEKTEPFEGTACVVLVGDYQAAMPAGKASKTKRILDKLWLNPRHGLAVRKRETQIDGQLVRVTNSDFVEVVAGFWLPKQSRTESLAPADGPKQFRDRPVVTQQTKLCLWVVNQTPDDLFDTALTKPRRWPDPIDLVPAYHWRQTWHSYQRGQTEEEWAVRDAGRRRDIRRGGKPESTTLDTPRWHYHWQVSSNRVMVLPSRLGEPATWNGAVIRVREDIVRLSEESTAIFAYQKERLGKKEADKLTFYFPVDSGGREPIHSPFLPKIQRKLSGTEFRTRTCWFDPKNGMGVQRKCGCKRPKHNETVDYPSPDEVPKELFKFQIPPTTNLEVFDPELGRVLTSEGQPEPDPQQ